MSESFPFLYLGPSRCDYRKALDTDIWFKSEIRPDERQEINKLVPYPLVLNRWGKHSLHAATDDLFSQRVRARYGNPLKRVFAYFGGMYTGANPSGLIAFHKRLDNFLETINRIHPILFFFKPGSDLYDQKDSSVKEEYSDWHAHSVSRIETEIVPVLTQYFMNAKEDQEDKAYAAWIIHGLFDFIPSRQKVSHEYAEKLVGLLKASLGYDSYIDEYLKNLLNAWQAPPPASRDL